jgi:hypothetical protein
MPMRPHTHRSPAAGQAPPPNAAPDVIDASALNERLRRAAGFRVDGPEGRIGTLSALVPGDLGIRPDRLRVDVGVFLRREIEIPVGDVRAVEPVRRRVVVRAAPRLTRPARAEVARRVRRFVHAAGAPH